MVAERKMVGSSFNGHVYYDDRPTVCARCGCGYEDRQEHHCSVDEWDGTCGRCGGKCPVTNMYCCVKCGWDAYV